MPEGAGSDWDRTTVWPECVGQQRRNRHEGEQGQPWLSSNRTGRHGITLMHRRPPRPMSHTSGELVLLHERDSVPEAIRADVALLAHAVQSVPEIALEPLLRAEPGRFAGLQPQAQRFALALSMTGILRTGGPRPEPPPTPRRRAA